MYTLVAICPIAKRAFIRSAKRQRSQENQQIYNRIAENGKE